MVDPYLELFSKTAFKQAVVAAPGGNPPPPPAPPGAPPMDPAMMGAPPMDPAMMGAPPMDPAMMGGMPPGAPPMDPAMMGGMPPGAPPMDIPTEIANIKSMLQQLMDAQVAMMQALAPAGAMPPPMPAGAPPMDPAMMGLPPTPPPGMVAQASDESADFTDFIKSVTELLR